ncbi:DUF2789 domain-containing protein [Alteromonas sp. ASW11-36]|uniref:DUF2789 domain-containing protein n=1 Tax=Alteromonas arenosi TaxID=3055817 RepID=A0ABT7SUG9_9ALTE|nr:DUF2789 domain-containing protein [Alteromonas sp. ASW11-36]MDM7859833.1 DUF2789 domain-containing protein [Alteromonas sp. ASW11-36]
MFTHQPTMADLFTQLGLDNSEAAIDAFIEKHKGLNETTYLHRAPYWNAAQVAFLKESIIEDAAWAEVIDELNARLH